LSSSTEKSIDCQALPDNEMPYFKISRFEIMEMLKGHGYQKDLTILI